MLLRLTLLLVLPVVLSLAGSVAAQDNPPPGEDPVGAYPVGNELLACEYPCRIYAAVPGPPFSPPGSTAGIYEIDVCQWMATRLLAPLPGAWNIAAAGDDSLLVSAGGKLFEYNLSNGVFSGRGRLPKRANSLTELEPVWYCGLGSGIPGLLCRVTPPSVTAIGAPPPSVGYSGDLAYWRDCETQTSLYAALGATASTFARVSRSSGAQLPIGPMGDLIWGLAFDGTGTLWASNNKGLIGPVNVATGAWTSMSTLPIIPTDLASTPRCLSRDQLKGDLGDAPDSTNHTTYSMTSYGAVTANFPSVFDAATGTPPGPMHWLPRLDVWLGANVSVEQDADLFPDEDLVKNIDPPTDTADMDLRDDGLVSPVHLPSCRLTQFQYVVNVVEAARDRYANAWIDYNRDGDWDDQTTCVDPDTQQTEVVNEWVVQDQVFNVGPGTHVLTSPLFRSLDVADEMWLRLTVSDSPSPASDGSGPTWGYEFGETEDYLLLPDPDPTSDEYWW